MNYWTTYTDDLFIVVKRCVEPSTLVGEADNGRIVGWLVSWVLWHINLCKLFNAKSIFM